VIAAKPIRLRRTPNNQIISSRYILALLGHSIWRLACNQLIVSSNNQIIKQSDHQINQIINHK